MTGRTPPSLEEVRGWLTTLSAWGRWGKDDELGTLNHIGDEQRIAALRLATGQGSVSCSLPVTYGRLPGGSVALDAGAHDDVWSVPLRIVVQDGSLAPEPETRFSAYDAFLIAPHGPIVTHLDAPGHTVLRGTAYNGLPASTEAIQPGKKGTIEAVRHGVIGRGVLLDVPDAQGRAWLDDGEAIYPEDLQACEARAGVRVGKGDLLFVRTGYRKRLPGGPTTRFQSRPGLQAACLPWFHERQISLIAADVAVDVLPHGYEALGAPVHAVGMWAMGLWLLDNCSLEPLAERLRHIGRWEFLTVLAPLVLTSGTGSPINPMAVL